MIRYGDKCDDKPKDNSGFYKFITSKKLYITLAVMLITFVYSTIYENLNEQDKMSSIPGIVMVVVFSIMTIILPTN